MSHKDKVCNTALTSHVEFCHEQHSYTPLVVSRNIWEKLPEKSGLKNLIKEELDEKMILKRDELENTSRKITAEIEETISNAFDDRREKMDRTSEEHMNVSIGDLKYPALKAIENELKEKLEVSYDQAKQEIIQDSDGRLDINNPEKAIDSREQELVEMVLNFPTDAIGYEPIPILESYELEGLGLFFKESVCHRPEGFTYSACGKEVTIMPGEEIRESNVLTTTVEEANSNNTTVTQNITTTDRDENVESFTQSYENTLRKETDIKTSKQASFKVTIPFKKVNLDLSSTTSGSINFKKIINEVNKSSHTNTRTRFNEVIRKVNTNSTANSSRSFTSTDTYTHNRSWKNDTNVPQTYVKRTSYCKTSVLHRRHNVQLAWQGCIDNPARDLCTPDNIEVKNAQKVQSIRNKWNTASVPTEFGPEPKDKNVETYTHTKDRNLSGLWYRVSISHVIPNGWFYVGNTADAHVDASVGVQGDRIESQPAHGATGTVTFMSRVDTRATRKPIRTKISFTIRSLDAQEWYERANAWREEQAQKEIEEFLANETAQLNQFLASDQARETIVRRIMEDTFGVTPIEDCCKLIARLYKLFDFENMGYSLLPSWNELGEGCQKAFPVNLYTAKCLHYYLPINPGMEREALTLLASVNAIPWSSQLAPQILAYVQQIQNMRATLYNRAFDPTGWDVKFDQPKGYDMTPYDATNADWSAAHESDLNFEVLGAFTINVPCGERIDKRPLLCE